MTRALSATIVFLVSLVLLALMPIAAQQQSDATQSRSTRFRHMGDRAIPNHYIVVLDQDAVGRRGDAASNAAQVATLMPEWAGTVTRRFDHALNGFAAFMTQQQAESL